MDSSAPQTTPTLEPFWEALESVPGLALTLPEWQDRLGPSFEICKRFLRPTDRRASSVPCPKPGGDGCPRRVVIHGHDDIVAVCGNHPAECDLVTLHHEDIVIYELSLRALMEEVAAGLGLQFGWAPAEYGAGTWSVGIYRSSEGTELPVCLSIPTPENEARTVVAEFLANTSGAFILLAPTASWLDARAFELLRSRECSFLALEDLVDPDASGRLTTSTTLEARLVAQRMPASNPGNVLRRSGEGWALRFGGSEDVYFGDLEGLSFLAVLLKNPGRELAPWEIANEAGDVHLPLLSGGAASRSARALIDDRVVQRRLMQDGAPPDHQARAACAQRLQAIDQELEEAEANTDQGKAERLRSDQQAIREYLSRQPRRSGRKKKERDRIVKNLEYALAKIRRELPALGSHLDEALQKGPRWRYRPDRPVRWDI